MTDVNNPGKTGHAMDTLNVQLRASEERYRTLFDLAPVAVYSCAASGVIEEFNRCAVELWGRTPALGDTDERFCGSFKLFRPDGTFMPHDQCPMAEVLSGAISEARDAEVLIERPDGSRISVVVNIRALKNQAGEVTGAINCFFDVTDRKQGEAARARLAAQMREANEHLVVGTVRAHMMAEGAEEANHLKDELLATVSHELRTPLNAIMGWARMLGSKQLPPDRASNALVVIDRNALALAHIIEDLLDVTRIVAGTLHLAPQAVDLVVVTQAALDVVRPLAMTRGVQLEFSPDLSAIDIVSGDAGRLQQVIVNLLANAIKFTAEGGRVDVFIAPSNGHMEIRVVDTGQGLSPDFLPHVFERFRQADGTPTRRRSGLGLGLAIVRELVELHGGTVSAASPGLGRGATFTVRLPISAGEAHAGHAAMLVERRLAVSMASPMPRLPRLDKLRILVVDDNADGRTLTSLVLTQAGASVKAVTSVREALDILEVEPVSYTHLTLPTIYSV